VQGQLLTEEQIKSIADLPPKEVLLAQAAGALNTVASKLARSINEVPASVARGINEVPASLGRALQAIASKEAA
jgi:large subunit ribosomal protein L10